MPFRLFLTAALILQFAAAQGKRSFQERCAGCHGEDGRGGGHGPAIVAMARPRTTSRDDLRTFIRNGAPSAGMPAFALPDAELEALADHVLSLRLLTVAEVAAAAPGARDGGAGIRFEDIAHPQPGSWLTYNGNLGGNRFSPLAQINRENVEHLAPRWMFTLPGATRNLETTPLVAGNVMYVTAANECYALDARSGREIWHYRSPRTSGVAGDAGGGINRGAALLGDRVFLVTDHAHLVALDRLTGKLLWESIMADHRQNYGSTSAPLVVGDLVVAGVSGGDEGVRGFLTAYRADTGAAVWRFWTVPERGEPGSETWQGSAIEHGCAATWFTGTYDPETRLLYWPTGNPCPDYNGDERKGDNLYSSSILALDPGTGRLKWHYQFTPHDLHDWDASEPPVLVDATFRGAPRKLLLHGNRNGFFYVLDRLTGKLLLAEPFVREITWASGIGLDGRPKLLPGNEPTAEGQRVCPSVAGAANWPSTAFHPATGLYYLFAQESCSIYSKADQTWQPGKSYYGGATRGAPGGGKFLKAIDIQTGKVAWEVAGIGGGILESGLMATAGGLIFYGEGSGAFVAADTTDGQPLWRFQTNARWHAGPMTYTADGRQYVAIAAGSTILAFGLM
jgi:alcohol dehydrogenase (cytochrome c)